MENPLKTMEIPWKNMKNNGFRFEKWSTNGVCSTSKRLQEGNWKL